LRLAGETNSYAKNLTLQTQMSEESKSGIVFMNCGLGLDQKQALKNPFVKLLKDSGVDIIIYKDVEKTKVQRSYSSSGVKKDASLGTIYARKLNTNSGLYASKLKMEYNKKESVMTDWDMRESEEGENNVLVPVNAWTELKDLDRTNIKVNDAIRCHANINSVIIRKESENVSELEISHEHTCKLLGRYGYRIVFVKRSELLKVKNDKNCIVGLTKAFNKLLKNKEFIKDVVNSARQSTIEEVKAYKKGSYAHDRLYKNPLKKKFLLLADFDVDKFKTPMADSLNDKNRTDHIFKGAAMLELADRFSKKVKGRDYSKYMTEEKLDEAMEKIAKSHPLMHYLFDKCDTERNWEFSDYDVDGESGETEIQGLTIIKEQFENMLNKELKKLKK
jgi:hypothetical protein